MMSKNNEAKSRFKCDHCPRSFPNKFQKKQHMKSFHIKERSLCILCKWGCCPLLEAHKRSRINVEGLFQCEKCKIRFYLRENLSNHVQAVSCSEYKNRL